MNLYQIEAETVESKISMLTNELLVELQNSYYETYGEGCYIFNNDPEEMIARYGIKEYVRYVQEAGAKKDGAGYDVDDSYYIIEDGVLQSFPANLLSLYVETGAIADTVSEALGDGKTTEWFEHILPITRLVA